MDIPSIEALPPLILLIIAILIILNVILWFFLPFYVRLINMRTKELNENLKYIRNTIEKLEIIKTTEKRYKNTKNAGNG